MRLTECTGDLLRQLAAMPFLDRLEMAAVSGWSRGSVYAAAEDLEAAGFAASVPHTTDLIPSTQRFHLTAAGLHRLARDEGVTVDELLRVYPVSAQWQRILLDRLDAVAAIYRLASTISNIAHPIRFRWCRALPMDAAVRLPDGRTIAVVRQGRTIDRTGFAKRIWRLWDGPQPSAVLMLMPDDVRLRHTRRLMTGAPTITFLALESEAVSAGPNTPVWRIPSGSAALDLRTALSHARPRAALPIVEDPPVRASLPEELRATGGDRVDGRDAAVDDHLLPTVLKATEKRCLDLLSDWPWVTPAHLGELLGVQRSRLSQLLQRLQELGLAVDAVVEGCRRLVLTDRGLAILARRDRGAVGTARQRWSTTPLDRGAPFSWRNVSGARSRQLLRNVEHTDAVHWFGAVLARQARSQGWDVAQLDPPHRASRYFRYGGALHSVRPDAFGILHKAPSAWPFFLEWERRAVRPVTMAARIAPYLRYFSTHRPLDDHGAVPSVHVVFDDDVAATHFLRVAQEEAERTGIEVPLWVSTRSALERVGPLGRAWRAPEDRKPTSAFSDR